MLVSDPKGTKVTSNTHTFNLDSPFQNGKAAQDKRGQFGWDK